MVMGGIQGNGRALGRSDVAFTWYLQYRDPGTKKYVRQATQAKTKAEAEVLLAETIQDISNGKYELKQNQAEIGFFEICEDFMAYSRAHKRSWKEDQATLGRLKEFFGNCLAEEIKPDRIRSYIALRKEKGTHTGKPIRPASINRELACLKTVFNHAVEADKVAKNPMRPVKFLKENNVRDRVLSAEEFERLLQFSPEHLKPILIAAHETGMRSGEIFGLPWDQVDLQKCFITLRPDQTKSNEGRKIPISPRLLETLSAMKKKTGIVFGYQGKSIKSIKVAFKRACQKAGIEDFRFHDLRHTFVTNMRRAGKQDRAIMAITGHKTMAMLMRYDSVD